MIFYETNISIFSGNTFRNGSAYIFWIQKFVRTFRCKPHLWSYPFDVNICSIDLKLNSKYFENPKWNSSMIFGQLNTSDIVKFEIEGLKYNFTDQNENSVKIYFILGRFYFSYLLTAFLPCIIIIMISEITVILFPLKDFTNRITVTLSLLIVVASLFAQTSSGFPKAAQPKIIELFFFYCIVKLFSVFLLHSIVGYYSNRISDGNLDTKKVFVAEKNKLNKHLDRRNTPVAHVINKYGFWLGILIDIIVGAVMVTSIMNNNALTIEHYIHLDNLKPFV